MGSIIIKELMINITIIGFGNVGKTLALLLLNNKHALRINIMEPNDNSIGAFLDLNHGLPLFDKKELQINNEEFFVNADYVYFTAGTPNKQGDSRLSTLSQNIHLSEEIFKKRTFKQNPFVIVITNPVDVISNAVYRYSGLSADKIIGTGTFLDSIRFNYYLSQVSGESIGLFDTMVLGEHGSSQVPIYSKSTFNGAPLLENSSIKINQLKQAEELTKNAAFKIRETQKGTTYGVAKCAEVLLDYILGKDKNQLTLSMLTNKHYCDLLKLDQPIFISMPVSIKSGKIEINNNIEFLEEELLNYRKSAAKIAEYNF
jgi:L-lactate dehydrogenase